jgi:hypothetical protein
MITSQDDRTRANRLRFGQRSFILETSDGELVEIPYSVSPRLLLATQDEREAGKLMPGGYGIEWEALNEHLSVDGLVKGKVSSETWRSVYEWYELRNDSTESPPFETNLVMISS